MISSSDLNPSEDWLWFPKRERTTYKEASSSTTVSMVIWIRHRNYSEKPNRQFAEGNPNSAIRRVVRPGAPVTSKCQWDSEQSL
jgi:hypothetical protein